MKKNFLGIGTLLFSILLTLNFSCSSNNDGNSASLPTISTLTITSITNDTAISSGIITSDGGANITTRGVVWNTSSGATIALSTKTTDGTGTGTFTSALTGLTPSTTYYARTYATNTAGTVYGNEIIFTTAAPPAITVTDIDGNIYQTITICNQIWTTNNLNVTKYRNGDAIPQVTDPTAWSTLTTGAWCYYLNNTSNGPIYGKLYNWYAVNDSRGLAPIGWHIPSDIEYTSLSSCLGGESIAGGKMKTLTLWNSPNLGASNSSGFSSMPGGVRYSNGTFQFLGYSSNYWTSTLNNTTVFFRNNVSTSAIMFRGTDGTTNSALSVRCVKD